MSLVFQEKNLGTVTNYTLIKGGTHHSFETKRATVDFVDTERFGTMFYIDGNLQASVFDEYIYHEFLVHPAMANTERPSRVCILGGSDGCALREVLKWKAVEKVVLVDWDQELVEHFKVHGKLWHRGAYADPRVSCLYSDIREFFDKPVTETFDVIIVDLLDPVYEDIIQEDGFWHKLLVLAQNLRNLGGTIVINSGGVLPWKYDTFYALFKRTLGTFREFHVQPYKVFVPSYQEEWSFLLIYKGELEDKFDGILTQRLCRKSFFRAMNWEKEYHPKKSAYGTE